MEISAHKRNYFDCLKFTFNSFELSKYLFMNTIEIEVTLKWIKKRLKYKQTLKTLACKIYQYKLTAKKMALIFLARGSSFPLILSTIYYLNCFLKGLLSLLYNRLISDGNLVSKINFPLLPKKFLTRIKTGLHSQKIYTIPKLAQI